MLITTLLFYFLCVDPLLPTCQYRDAKHRVYTIQHFERSAFFVRKTSCICNSCISTGVSHSIIAHKKSFIEFPESFGVFPKSFIARKKSVIEFPNPVAARNIQRQRAAFHLSKAIIQKQ
jgi:hypothetical protein